MSSVEAPRKIVLRDKETVNEIAAAMKKREKFIIATDDPNFNPLGYDRHSAEVWLGATGGGVLMTIGGGALVLAFLDPEPTSKLSLLVAGGIIMTLAGGAVIMTVLVMRGAYSSVMTVNKATGQFEWTLEPR